MSRPKSSDQSVSFDDLLNAMGRTPMEIAELIERLAPTEELRVRRMIFVLRADSAVLFNRLQDSVTRCRPYRRSDGSGPILRVVDGGANAAQVCDPRLRRAGGSA